MNEFMDNEPKTGPYTLKDLLTSDDPVDMRTGALIRITLHKENRRNSVYSAGSWLAGHIILQDCLKTDFHLPANSDEIRVYTIEDFE